MLYRSIVSATSLVRRELFEELGGFDPRARGYEDWDFYLGALSRGWRGVRVPTVTLCYRRHGDSKVDADRSNYRRAYRLIHEKHAELYGRARSLAAESDLGPLGRLFYRTYWAHRPLPARLERALYGVLFR
jgi:GT2 family glycosyltransferase